MRCPSRQHQPIAFYVPGCGLDLWLGATQVALIGASCRVCAEPLFGLGSRVQPENISEWRTLDELFDGRGSDPARRASL